MRTPRPLTYLLGALLGALLTVAGALPGAGPARAADNGNWSVYPTPAAGQQATSRAYFFHQGAAGGTVTDSVTLTNSSAAPITFLVFATDATNTPAGGAFALLPVEKKPKDLGTWITLPPEVAGKPVTVPPKGRRDIPFTVRIPEDANPGDHVGGIVALNTRVEGVKKEGKVQVGVRRSVGARFYLRVPGPLTAALSVEGVSVKRDAPLLPWSRKAPATISYSLVNRGNVVLDPQVAMRAQGLFGREVFSRRNRDLHLVLLPGQRIDLTEAWAASPQLDWVTLKVTATAADHPDERQSAETGFLAVPWAAAGLLLLLAGAGLATWVLHRRTRRATTTPEPEPQDLATTG
ncbi:DUF916 domain-containing protein [Streptomyces sp. NPDC089919]|uniref:WxL protein peptidoglycan domain-containing protein n=1 Tax=Streptomyces sp. NPDC089919 TaxID=3155188 RepID=UPI00343BBBB6